MCKRPLIFLSMKGGIVLEEAGTLYTYRVTDTQGHPCTDMVVLRDLATRDPIPCGETDGAVVCVLSPTEGG